MLCYVPQHKIISLHYIIKYTQATFLVRNTSFLYPIQTQTMKTITQAVVLLLLVTTTNIGFAQQKSDANSKEIFANFSDKVNFSKSILQTTITAKSGESVSIPFNTDFIFNGVVVSNEVKYKNLQTVIIKSTSLKDALLQISKITNEDLSESFVGRIINTDANDGYSIEKDEANNYKIEKIEMKNILQDCSF